MEYKQRFVDQILLDRLGSSGAVILEGPKACGKTETALQVAGSFVHMDTDEQVPLRMDVDPGSILEGKVPRLLDEWQEYPKIWNHVRREVDERKCKGQFILTGSATPNDSVRRHSGAGRFSIIQMRPMSLFERGWSTGEVSLLSLMQGHVPSSRTVDFSLENLGEMITLGGWPGLLHGSVVEGLRFTQDYISLISEAEISRASGKRRDPLKVKRLIQSIARNISTEATLASLAKDAGGKDGEVNYETITEYMTALERLMILENLPAWNTHIRSADTLRKAPKRHFVDPSLAVGALGLTVDKLVKDLNYLGLLFESLAIRDLRVYAESVGGKVYHYRDSRGLEIDAIVELADGTWAGFEIKLGIGAADSAAAALLKFAEKIDTEKMKEPLALTVITANGFAHRRADGVHVVPLLTLTR